MSAPHPLRLQRELLGWSQGVLAAKARVGIRTIQRIECQRHEPPRFATRKRLMRALGVAWPEHRAMFERVP